MERVIDGDTIQLEGGIKVRLIGVDTPELHHPSKPVMFFAEEAHRFVKSLSEGEEVTLTYDQQRIGKYGRTLAYVYLSDGTLLNAEIIRQGYGFAYTRFPFEKMEEFRQFEQEAREEGRGFWESIAHDPDVSHLIMLYQRLSPEGKELAQQELSELLLQYGHEEEEVLHGKQGEGDLDSGSGSDGGLLDRAILLPPEPES